MDNILAPTYSISSHMMSNLITWRNPQGHEANWYNKQSYEQNESEWLKVISTSFGLPFIAVAAIIETIAYTLLFFYSSFFYPLTDKPLNFFARLASSSLFTLGWTIVICIPNFVVKNLITNESFARDHVSLDETEDYNYVYNVKQNIFLTIKTGTDLILKYILKDTDNNTIEKFRECDDGIFHFVPAKTAYYYIFGPGKNDPTPVFLKAETKNKIVDLRNIYKNITPSETLLNSFKNLTNYLCDIDDQLTAKIFNDLKSAGALDLQESLYITTEYKAAVESLGGML